MRNILVIAKNTLKVTFRKKSRIITLILLPIASILISMSMYGSSSATVRIGICDKDKSDLSQDLSGYLGSIERFKINKISEKEIKDKVLDEDADCAIIIPQGFSENILNGSVKNIDVVSIKGETVTAWVKNYVNMYIKNVADIGKVSGGDQKKFNKIYSGFKKGRLSIENIKIKDEYSSKSITTGAIGFLILFMLIGATNTTNFILKEKRDRTYYRICSAPVSSRQYILGNLLSNVLILLIQVIAVLTIITKVMRIEMFVPFGWMVLILMCFGVVAISIGMIIVAFSHSTYMAGNLSTIIITPTCMLGGCFWSISVMPESIQKLADFMPQRWAIRAVTSFQSGQRTGAFVDIFILLAFAAAFFLISIYKMRSTDVKSFI
jgi:ABC-2 type transport system permease protein